jgi:mannose-6-phosphate isomerase-like protein (cupin superfamily)
VAEQGNGQSNGQGGQQWNRLYFDEWVAREGLDLIRGYKVDNVYTVPLKPWARVGGNAVHIQLEGTGELNSAYVCEIPPGKQLHPQRHLYEELTFVLSGRGSTTVWYEEGRKNSFEWKAGSMFAIPLNASFQHFNGSGQEPARYVAITTAPIMLNLIRNDDFIFNNEAVFPERYGGEDDYFSGKIETHRFTLWDSPKDIFFSNFYPDIYAIDLEKSDRGVNSHSRQFEIANGVLAAHTSEYPGGTFTNAHFHGPGAHVLWLAGNGYTLMWPDKGEKIQADWGPGTMVVPPSYWWHSHAVTTREPGRYLALRFGSKRNPINRVSLDTMKSTRRGGQMLRFEDFPQELMDELRERFARECAKRGTPVNMEPVYNR